MPDPHPNPRNPVGVSVTRPVLNYGKSVTMSVIGGSSGLQIPIVIVSELIIVTDADTDIDYRFLNITVSQSKVQIQELTMSLNNET